MPCAKFTVPSMGSTTQRYSACASPASPSSPSNAICGKAACSFFSINFWQRTSSSSLMSCDVISFAFFLAVRFFRMTAPAALAAAIAEASAFWDETVLIKIFRSTFERLERLDDLIQLGFQVQRALLMFSEHLRR